MKCEVCKKEAMKNSIVCSDHCAEIRLKIIELDNKYFPTNGCDNCWGDLHNGCSQRCRNEFSQSLKFGRDLWDLTRLIILPITKGQKG